MFFLDNFCFNYFKETFFFLKCFLNIDNLLKQIQKRRNYISHFLIKLYTTFQTESCSLIIFIVFPPDNRTKINGENIFAYFHNLSMLNPYR